MITIRVPNSYEPERRYILSLLFREFLGVDIRIQTARRRDVEITAGDGRTLVVADGLFGVSEDQWLQPESLPRQPLKAWNLTTAEIEPVTVSDSIPVIYGNNPNSADFFTLSERHISLGLDIFGAAFFMLTRYEEVVNPARDNHDRFPAKASLAYQEGFLARPIINEYLEILWACLKRLWPRLQRKPRQFQIHLTHDVDEPLCVARRTFAQVVRSIAGDVVKRRKPALARRRLQSFVQVRRGNPNADACNTFDFIMDLSEEHDLKSGFYFIADHSAGRIDGAYSIEDPWIRKLLRRIHERGHEVGLHPSYNSYRDTQQIQREFRILLNAAAAENISQELWGGRQHFLRWEAPTTWRAWDDAGLDYDSSLGFADHAGFRCGVCYEFPAYDLGARRTLSLRERPLIAMEHSLLGLHYMRLSPEQAWHAISELRARCRIFNGYFTLLWHNSELIDPQAVELYRRIVDSSSDERSRVGITGALSG